MANKITQLNEVPDQHLLEKTGGCGYEQEIPGAGIDQDFEDLKNRVQNYKTFMTGKYGVPEEKLFNVVVFDIKNMNALLTRNPTATGLRVYLSKNTADPQNLDYEIIIIPTKDAIDQNGNKYFLDMLDVNDPPANVFISYCRRPPGCPDQGALLD